VYVKSSLEQLGKGLYHIIPTAFSAQTSANQVQQDLAALSSCCITAFMNVSH
jgi:hypothetical protein